MTGETSGTTASTWRTLAEALARAQRAERRHGWSSRQYKEAYASYLVALAGYQTAASQQAERAFRQSGY